MNSKETVNVLSCFKTLDQFEEKEPEWLIPGRIPKGQITTIGSDGGVGKTTISVYTAAPISRGERCFLDPPNHSRPAGLVAFISTEDSVSSKLKRKLREAGADMENIICPDFSKSNADALRDFKFGSEQMALFVEHYKPTLCIFDPLQGFIPPLINMGARNAMRDCMAPLISLGEQYGTTFLILCHTNKRKGASGRDRLADSADIWDISRSVLMGGYTDQQGIRYLSHEKSNYGELQPTILFTIDKSGTIHAEGETWKRDREFMSEAISNLGPQKMQDCQEWILALLDDAGGSMPSKDLDEQAKAEGYSKATLRRAKDKLKENNEICYRQVGARGEKIWFTDRLFLPAK